MSVKRSVKRGKAILKTLGQDYKSVAKLAGRFVKEKAPLPLPDETREVKIPSCYYVATSADGLIADAFGRVDWLKPFLDEDYGFHSFLDSIDTVVMGRRTYERFIKSTRTNPYEGKRFVVLSHSLTSGPHAHLFWRGPLRGLMVRLEIMGSKSLWIVGGGSVAGTFLEAGLLDEVHEFVLPVVLGSGTPIFGPLGQPASLRLKKAQPLPNGVLQLRYAVDEGRPVSIEAPRHSEGRIAPRHEACQNPESSFQQEIEARQAS
jgi:dihydrofolate reductase